MNRRSFIRTLVGASALALPVSQTKASPAPRDVCNPVKRGEVWYFSTPYGYHTVDTDWYEYRLTDAIQYCQCRISEMERDVPEPIA